LSAERSAHAKKIQDMETSKFSEIAALAQSYAIQAHERRQEIITDLE